MSSIQTTCPYCGVGCGVIAQTDESQITTIEADKTHPANFGRLCSKGIALGTTLGLEGRLLLPEVQGKQCDWDTALDEVANQFQNIIAEQGPQAVAFYVSGQLLTEDYYVANKLMKGFMGSANIDTNSRLCMSSSLSGYKRAFGSDSVPGNYEDMEETDLLVLVGSNLAWCHPVLFQRISAAKDKRPELKVVVIDPRHTATCEIADVHLSIKSGSDVWLFNGLLDFLRRNDYLDYDFLENATEGFASALEAARASSVSIPAVAGQCGLDEEQVSHFFRLFAQNQKVVTLYSQGVNQSTSGTDKVNSIINCHLATGRLGKPGMGPFSMTGQPNAMGGREVGALANQLASHMDFTPEHCALVQDFWHSPLMPTEPGLKVVDLFKAMAAGEVKAIWIMATNPAVSLPNSHAVKQALEKCELVVVSDCVRHNDTTAYADILLPALAWGEKDGTVTNSERRISRQRPFLDAPGEAKPDWWIISQIAERLGYAKQFAYRTPADIFREYATLSGYKNNGSRDLDLSGLLPLSDEEYQTLKPVQWPICDPIDNLQNVEHCTGLRGTARLFTDRRFFTQSGKAQLISITPRLPAHLPDVKFPLILNTGRIRDQWHTMTRTGKSARLLRHIDESYVEIHPDDAKTVDINEGSLVQISSRLGQWLGRAKVSQNQQIGNVFVPMHFNAQNSSRAVVDALIMSSTDPISGQPEFKHTPVRISLYRPAWQGFILSKHPLTLPDEHINYWAKILSDNGWRYELAGETRPDNWADWIHQHFGENLEWLEYQDRATGRYRCANIIEGHLNICVFIAQDQKLPARQGLITLFTKDSLSPAERLGLLTVQAEEQTDSTICACFNVRRNELLKGIYEQNLRTPAQIGDKLKAGSNCGSCIPELKGLLKKVV
ncbi:MAG: nitrate reductase [Candidatus Parabeggiatoa sp. nov. 3]|nr:MAG: nitrate reductase [Gammaproteobacteria bacterium]RKZ63790.1 MAG: nitrate reductase [Gammaproteobacteria bacterium]RKZ82888.1 MAG: nitrate reductase [Gammaproteobacteria bacterium]